MKQVVNKCLESKLCTTALLGDTGNEAQLNALYVRIAKEHLPIKQVIVSHSDLNNGGKLTEQGVSNLLATVCKDNLIGQCPLDKKCTTVKDIMNTAGWATEQLFIITNSCGGKNETYILKGLPKVSEAFALEAINFLTMKEIVYPNTKKDFPTLALPYTYFEYRDESHIPRYLSLMPAAKGEVFINYIKKYQKDPSDVNYNNMLVAFESHGRALAVFHKTYGYPHIDLHTKNIFFDKDSKLDTFIDNDNLGKWAARSKFPTFIHEFNENFWGDEHALRTTPFIKDIRIIWDTLDRDDFLGDGEIFKDRKFMEGSVKAFEKGYTKGWGAQASAEMAKMRGVDHCLDSLLEKYEHGDGCSF